jgi:phosphoserine phosphatase RsbU/P
VKELAEVLEAFYDATGCAAAVWSQSPKGDGLVALGAAPVRATPPPIDALPTSGAGREYSLDGGRILLTPVPGPRRLWLVVGPCLRADGSDPVRGFMKLLLPVVTQYVQASLEVEHAASELAERYEEINLLYTTSEILGRTVSLEEAATTILTEISETVGARRGAILVHDRVTDTLLPAAALGTPVEDVLPIAVDDQTSLMARVFRTQHGVLADDEEVPTAAEATYRKGFTLSVPIMWTTPDGGEPLGVVCLSDRRSRQPFTAGDQKLVAAIAAQIGTAIQNARLVRASLAQQQLVHEMQMAHDLQMKLLPSAKVVAPEAEVAARVVPAESVGGDFYHLFRLGGRRTGVMIGDVSSHGYRAALIMALAMSASAIHAQRSDAPELTLEAIRASLRDELETTEMFVSAFYGVIDAEARVLRYANTGHPHAFAIREDGTAERLRASDPPLGMADEPPSASSCSWSPGRDLLLLFTDGISDARNRIGAPLREESVLAVVRELRAAPVEQILERVFAVVAEHAGGVAARDDQTLVVVRA